MRVCVCLLCLCRALVKLYRVERSGEGGDTAPKFALKTSKDAPAIVRPPPSSFRISPLWEFSTSQVQTTFPVSLAFNAKFYISKKNRSIHWLAFYFRLHFAMCPPSPYPSLLPMSKSQVNFSLFYSMQHIFRFLVFLAPSVSSLARVRKFCWPVQVVPYKVANELKGATNSAGTTYSK